jgi:hypothetical protein
MEDYQKDDSQFDRYTYVTSSTTPERSSSGVFGGFVVAVLLLGLGGLGFYLAVEKGWILSRGAVPPTAAALEKRLAGIEERLERLETRRTASPVRAEEPRPVAASTQPRATPAEALSPRATALPSATPPAPSAHLPAGAAQSSPPSSNDAWRATASRLGQTVGEVGEQRRQIRENRQALEQLLASQDRTQHPFRLERRGGQVRVGPVLMELRRVDRRRQTYTLQMLVDDRPVEFRDRVVMERVEFYSADSARPMELIVRSISDNAVEGVLLVARSELSFRP